MDFVAKFNACMAAVGAVKSAIEARDTAKETEATNELHERLLPLYGSNFTLMERVDELHEANIGLEEKIAKLKAKIAERAPYRLCKNDKWNYFYRFTPKGKTKDEPHDLCQRRYDEGA
jgi:hypothetical protein